MPTSQASAVWEGKLKDGKGTFTAGSGAFSGPYSFATRFEGKPGTNPEELIAAAHAACFSMALSAGLEKAGKPAARRSRSTRSSSRGVGKGDEGRVWTVYMLRCRDRSLYTGITNDLPGRLARHRAGTASAYTRARLPVRLVYQEPQPDRGAALRREAALRRLSRAEKLTLVSRR